jgi:hypothetical protein
VSNRIGKRMAVGAAVAAVAVMGLGAAPASAGEITGNGEYKQPMKGKSICSFSGQNDNFHDPEAEGGPEDERVQSFGQIVRHAGPIGGVPGFFCNPTRYSH